MGLGQDAWISMSALAAAANAVRLCPAPLSPQARAGLGEALDIGQVDRDRELLRQRLQGLLGVGTGQPL
jgi:hypothetical protein